jgi:hypothetical protein
MAKVTRREWISPGPMNKLVRHVAFGYTLATNGERGARSPRHRPLKRMR